MQTQIFEKMDLKHFLSLCDTHHSIIQEFGSNPSCSSNAAVCIKGCFGESGTHKYSKHDFIKAKKLYGTVSQIRHNFQELSNTIQNIQFPLFMKKIREQIDQFQQFMKKQMNNKINLMQKYCAINNMSFKLIQTLVTPKLQDLQLSDLKCKEVALIQLIQSTLKKQNIQFSQEKIEQFYRRFFLNYLKTKQYLSEKELLKKNKQNKIDRMPRIVEVNYFKELPAKMFSLLKDFQQEKMINQIQKLIICIREPFQYNNQPISETNVLIHKTLQTNVFFKGLQIFIKKAKLTILFLSVNIKVDRSTFWEKFLGVLSKCTNLLEVTVYTSKQIQSQHMSKFVKLYQVNLHLKIQQNIQWDDDTGQLNKQQMKLTQKQISALEQMQKTLEFYDKTQKFI